MLIKSMSRLQIITSVKIDEMNPARADFDLIHHRAIQYGLRMMFLRDEGKEREVLSEERCEYPTVITIHSVISDDGLGAVATGDADEWTSRIRRIIFIFAAGRFITFFGGRIILGIIIFGIEVEGNSH